MEWKAAAEPAARVDVREGRAVRRLYWVDLNRFDEKPNKSTWVEMARALGRNGYAVTVLTGRGRSENQSPPRDGFIYFGAADYPLIFRGSLTVNILKWLLRNAAPEDIIMLTPPALFMAPVLRAAGRRNLHLDVRTVPVEVGTVKKRFDRMLFWSLPMRMLRRYAGGWSFITARLKAEVEREFHTRIDDCVIWTSGVNTERFLVEEPAEGARGARPFNLFYHGTVTHNRGVDLLVRAYAEVRRRFGRDIVLTVVGNGAALESIKALAARLGVSDGVVFKGLVPYERIPAEIAAADCCVCPLPDRPEWNVSSPLKVFEYLAAGKPVILTPIPAHTDVLDQEDFVVWTKGYGVADFAEAIEVAVRREAELGPAARRGMALARERFDWNGHGARLAGYLDRTFGTP